MSNEAFWTNVSPWEPKRQFRFKVYFGGLTFKDEEGSRQGYEDVDEDDPFIWYAKSIDKPTMTFKVANEGEANVGSQIPDEKILSVPKMSDITMTLVDPSYPNASRKLLRLARRAGYLDKKAASSHGNLGNFDGDVFRESIGRVYFEQLDHGTLQKNGKHKATALETWELQEAYIKSINFGKLDYSSDEFVEITVVLGYTSFTCIQHGVYSTELGSHASGPSYEYNGTRASTERSFQYYKDPTANAFTQTNFDESDDPSKWNFSKE